MVKDVLGKLVEFYKKNWEIPKKYRDSLVAENLAMLRPMLILLLAFGVYKLIAIKLGISVSGEPVPKSMAIYYHSYVVFGGIGFLYLLLIRIRPKMLSGHKNLIVYIAFAFAMATSVYCYRNGSTPLTGILVFVLVSIVAIIIFNIEPFLFMVMVGIPVKIIGNDIKNNYGMDVFMDFLILTGILVFLALYKRNVTREEFNHREKLEEATIHAQAADRAKSAFLARMSHEIRSPINVVLGLDEMVIRQSNDPVIRKYAFEIKNSGNSLLATINDILDFSKIESEKMELLPAEYDLVTMVKELGEMTIALALGKPVQFKVEINPKTPQKLIGDSVRIKQVVLNLLSNAVKYTESGEVKLAIDFELTENSHTDRLEDRIMLNVSISDTGKGIREEDREKIYKPFERAEDTNHHIQGTGLGIAISRQILELMDSELKLQTTLGSGSTFSFSIRQDVKSWEPVGNIAAYLEDTGMAEDSAFGGSYIPSFLAPEARILVVDDIPVNLMVFTELLRETQMQIDTASSGQEAVEKAGAVRYDLIFLDHMMPGMDGIETLYTIREDKGCLNYNTPAIMLTANAAGGVKEEYLEAGFDGYIAKPLEPQSLEATIMKMLPSQLVHDINGSEAAPQKNSKYKLTEEQENILAKLRETEGIDVVKVVKNIGNPVLYLNVVEDFYRTGNLRMESLKNAALENDRETVKIEAHTLKSSARMIGEEKLSKLAERVEKGMSNDLNRLIAMYAETLEKLAPIYAEDDSEKPLIEEEMLKSMLRELEEAMEVFDFTIADAIMDRLCRYRMPEDFKDEFEKLRALVVEVDSDSIIEILGNSDWMK